ncbi:META domain-containing protein [Kineosporia sp. J2-2]|uniref:META domain-containing protein n=1 Tax=Kineosporia corallincola TaxID=2835133 RepID=A0ABS5TIN8_9ACTN|nr:META domain-containing protein [Kineosporia corallincola]MBT0770875.1 META domain-containing protein [Kineosporia corallincola]
MRREIWAGATTALLPVLLLAGCGEDPGRAQTSSTAPASSTREPAEDPRQAIAGTWYPASIVGYTVSPLDEPSYRKAFLEFDDGDWKASDGCNGMRGTYELGADGDFEMKTAASTEIGCANVPHYDVLDRTTTVRVTGDELVFSAAGEQIARYSRTATVPASPAGTPVGKRTEPEVPPRP